jgi:DeoR family ulaG and ulaABCDEF operon transcriptional repressor
VVGASPATIRRDVAALARAGRIRRTWGGVEAPPPPAARPAEVRAPHFESTRVEKLAEKRAIARAAALLCAPGDSVIINGGTTPFAMGEFIAEMGLQVLTNSFALAAELVGRGNCRVVLPGGDVYRDPSLIVSPYDRDTVIDHYVASKLFIGARAVQRHGLIEGDPLLIKAEQRMIDRAEELVVLVDGSKFAARTGFIMCPLARVGHVITDVSAPREALDMLARAGIRTTIVEPEA